MASGERTVLEDGFCWSGLESVNGFGETVAVCYYTYVYIDLCMLEPWTVDSCWVMRAPVLIMNATVRPGTERARVHAVSFACIIRLRAVWQSFPFRSHGTALNENGNFFLTCTVSCSWKGCVVGGYRQRVSVFWWQWWSNISSRGASSLTFSLHKA